MANVISKVRSVKGFRGPLRSGDLVQDLISPGAGLLRNKPSVRFADLKTAAYAGPGCGRGCNYVFRGQLHEDPLKGSPEQLEAAWGKELRTLLQCWERSGLSGKVFFGRRQTQLGIRMIEFAACDFQRAVK